jgi:hypothetical protein
MKFFFNLKHQKKFKKKKKKKKRIYISHMLRNSYPAFLVF